MKTTKLVETFFWGLCAAGLVFGQSDIEKIIPPHLLTEALSINGDIEVKSKPKYLSPNDIVASPDNMKLYVTEQTAKRVARIDIATKSVDKTILLPNEPTGVTINKDGTKLYVTIGSERWSQGYVCEIDASSGKIIRRIAVGNMARSPVLAPSGDILYTCNWFSNDVSVIDVAAGREIARIPVTREPYAAAITPDGKTLAVTNSLPDQKATDTVTLACKVALVNTDTRTVRAQVPLPVGSHSLFGICITADGKFALATHLIGRFNIPATMLSNGWVHSNNLAIVDIENGKLTNDVELDLANQGCANPWGVTFTGDNKYLCIAHMGTSEMSIIQLPELLDIAQKTPDLSHEFNATYSIKTKVKLSVEGPRALTAVNNKIYVTGYFSDFINAVTVTGLNGATIEKIDLGPEKTFTSERQGERNFSDASICFQKWQTCFSCHPFTRPDAINWILNTTNSTPKNAKSMLYAWWTPPTSWAAKRPHAGGPDGSIRSGISAELFVMPTEDVGVPLDTFFMWMRPAMSPHLDKGKLSESAKRGKEIFSKVGCKYCHPAPLYTDMKFHNAGVEDPWDANTDWDTPSLIEAWRTSPFGHTGSYDKIEDIIKLRTHSLGASNLTTQELDDLVKYVLSL
ncbi:MAG: c-type cytochrome [Fibrobacter sp.]|nr:c-type cytochrome [Fibrobacter sp.]